jgi:hypothetical protein
VTGRALLATEGCFVSMAAVLRIADSSRTLNHVREVPKAEVSGLFDHLGGVGQKCGWGDEVDCFRGPAGPLCVGIFRLSQSAYFLSFARGSLATGRDNHPPAGIWSGYRGAPALTGAN